MDISHPGNRVTRTTWPGVSELHDINSINREEVKQWANLFPNIKELHIFAGFPCIHLSSAGAFRQNLEEEGSNLFWKMLQILGWVQGIFNTFCKVKFCVENVASMDTDARFSISNQLEVAPVKLDPGECPLSAVLGWLGAPNRCLRWGLQLWKDTEYTRAYVSAEPIETKQWIRPGWEWKAEKGTLFPTFMKAIRRSKPPPKPAGLERCDSGNRWRWVQDEYRFPPYQYKLQFLLQSAGRPDRLPDASEPPTYRELHVCVRYEEGLCGF